VRNSRNVSVATCAIVPGWLSVTPSSNDAADDRDGDGAGRLLAERADDQVQAPGVVALVEDDHRLGAGLLRVERLDAELAGAPLDEDDVGVAAQVEAGEVLGLAAAVRRPVAVEVDVDGDHGTGDVTRAGELVRAGLQQRRRGADDLEHRVGQLLEVRELEALARHLVAGLLQLARDVVGRGVVAGRARRPGAAVVVRDLLERLEVLEHPLGVHALEQLVVGVVGPALAGPVVAVPPAPVGCGVGGQRGRGDGRQRDGEGRQRSTDPCAGRFWTI